MSKETYQHAGLTELIIGCAMRVHREVGAGFPEVVYQRCLAIELRHAGVQFEKEIYLPLYYRTESVGSRRADFLIAGVVLVELKATTEITPAHHAQVINYLKAYRLEVGLLINFGEESLRYKRFVKTPNYSPATPNSSLKTTPSEPTQSAVKPTLAPPESAKSAQSV